MIKYTFKLTKHKDIFSVRSPQFPNVVSYASNEEAVLKKFFFDLDNELNCLINANKLIPAPVSNPQRKEKGDGSFALSLSAECTVLLYNAMQRKGIDRKQLATLLALTEKDVKPEDWQSDKLKNIKPSTSPKYKKVQRLLDVCLASTINEMTEAFRVIGCYLNIKVENFK